jgi:hypothetical protein
MRARHFRLVGRFDGVAGAGVTIEPIAGGGFLFRVRPLRRRRSFDLPLEDVARAVIYDVVRAELRAKAREKAAARGARRRR